MGVVTQMTQDAPAPGSPEAVKAGCKCPVLDNNNGRGIDGELYWINVCCPLHGDQKVKDE